VLANLIGNAIKFTGPGGKITTSMIVAPQYVEMVIQDNGRGIPENAIPRLFERFTRAPENGSETIGSGLGLMIVREIVEAHHGIIGVESELGLGSKFWFRLPRNV
jgi:signal transduction histidine kinase